MKKSALIFMTILMIASVFMFSANAAENLFDGNYVQIGFGPATGYSMTYQSNPKLVGAMVPCEAGATYKVYLGEPYTNNRFYVAFIDQEPYDRMTYIDEAKATVEEMKDMSRVFTLTAPEGAIYLVVYLGNDGVQPAGGLFIEKTGDAPITPPETQPSQVTDKETVKETVKETEKETVKETEKETTKETVKDSTKETTKTTTKDTAKTEEKKDGLSTGAIIGIIAAAVVVVAVVVIVIVKTKKKK